MDTNFEEMLGLEFIGKNKRNCRNNDVDVTVSKIKDGISITFRNETWELVGNKLLIAIKGDCLYFKSGDNGWSVSNSKGAKHSRYLKICGQAMPKQLNSFIGDYDLKVMDPLGIYYIQKKR